MPIHGVDFDRTAETLGPFGQGSSSYDFALISKGECAIDSAHYSADDIERLGQCTLDIWNETV